MEDFGKTNKVKCERNQQIVYETKYTKCSCSMYAFVVNTKLFIN